MGHFQHIITRIQSNKMAGKYNFVAMGNPLLDMQVSNGEELLKKYNLKANDAILAEGQQKEIYTDLEKNYKPVYVAGGAAQNAARGAQYVLPAGSTAYIGCVGKDALADQLRAANEKEGLYSAYQVVEDAPTGACAVVITGHHRSLCTELGAAEKFTKEHLEKAEVKEIIEGAKFYYLGGFFLTHGIESAMTLAKHSKDNGKTFAMNLSAPFIPQFFKTQVDEILPYVDVLIGNESEAEAFAQSHEYGTSDLVEIAKKLAAFPKANSSKPRLVVITHGAEDTIVVQGDNSHEIHEVGKLSDDQIVDTNGAGDAFAGGFCGALSLGKSVDEAVAAGHKMGAMCVKQLGPTFKWPKEQIL